MPKASYDMESMYQPGFGFVETIGSRRLGEVTGCVSRYVQWQANKKTGAQVNPLTSVVLSIAQIDASSVQIAQPVEQELVVEWGPKDGSLIRVRPGLADTRDGDAGDTSENGALVLGTEGNCLFVEEGTKVNMTNTFGVFVASCQQKGFKPQILNAGFLPDFVGLRAWFDLAPGRAYGDKKAEDVPTFVVQEIVRFPYEQAATAQVGKPKGRPAAAAKPVAAGAPAPAAAPTPAPAPKPNGVASAAPNAEVESACLAALQKVSANAAASSTGDMTRQKIMVLAIQQVLAPGSGVDKSKHPAIQALLRDEHWFAENAISFGAVNTGDDKWMMVGA
jgi:hypothetical protein